ncbi:DHA2 family efflux MFS transporter permease subunit [Alsobacter sp. SYSU M60028]|uniref:DHA2 family efflux MFS transporter permease subunit n=1 Tax=Alsobacter ponti TaxID=2962936 RepID=A0ABT1LJZ8_9HYPH|nr:DHA2 family efflux MFS transporter permease subunit [Alsobacter ponti]
MPPDDTPSLPGGQIWKITAVVSFGPFLSQLDTTVVNVALSTLSVELNAPLATIQWVATGYLLALALMIPLNGWLVDRVGPKRVYLSCFALFTAASTCCGLSQTVEQLVGFRILQGMAGGLLAPMAQMMIAHHAGPRMAKMMSFVGIPVLVAPIFGPSVAGAILHVASWHWLFLMNLPVGVAAIVAAAILLPADGALRPRPLDLLGFGLVSPGLVFLLDGFKRFATSGKPWVAAGEVAAAVVLLASFVVRSLRRGTGALIDVRLFRHRTFAASARTQFLANATVQGGQMLIPLYLLAGRDVSPASVGLLLAPMGLGLLAGRPFLDFLIRTFGPRRVSTTGGSICLAATLPFAWPGLHMPLGVVAGVLLIRGFGLSLVNLPSIVSAYTAIPRASLTDAATAINIVQRLGGPVSTMSIALLLQHLAHGVEAGSSGAATAEVLPPSVFPAGFALLCVVNLLCILAASRLPLVHTHSRPESAERS